MSQVGDFDIKKWATDNNLSQETLEGLLNEGFDSIKSLTLLTPEDVMQTFRKEKRLPLAQVSLLKEAVRQLQGESIPGSIKTLRFLLMGKTGVGKSSTGNTILGEKIFKTSSTFNSMAQQCDLQRGVVDNIPIEIIDCPGLHDTKVSVTEIARITVKTVAFLHPGPDGFIFVIRAGRFTEEEEGTFTRFVSIFDDKIIQHMIIIFTGGDDLISNGENIEENLRNAPETLKAIVRACEDRYIVFDNNSPEKKTQVRKFLEMAYKLVNRNNYQCYKCPKYSSVETKVEEEVKQVFAELLKQKKITEREKELMYTEVLNRLKDRIAKNEAPDLLDVLVNTVKGVVMAPVKIANLLEKWFK